MPSNPPRPEDWKHALTELSGKRALVTGGSTGIGRATVRLLVSQGAKVLTDARHEEDMREVTADCQGLPGELHTVVADQAEEADIGRVFDQVDERLGGLDILVNNAAIGGGSLTEMDYDQMRQMIDINVLGYLACCKFAIERMGNGGGHIINIGSMSADVREKGSTVYVATKAAIQAASESLRKLANPKGIKVSLIEPGRVGTDMPDSSPDEQRQQQAQDETLAAEDIAECVYYCLSQPARCDVVSVQIRPHQQMI